MSINPFSPLTLYYLEQIGITPWIHKKASSDGFNPLPKMFKLLVVTSTNLNHQTQLFLNRVLDYLHFNKSDVIFITGENEPLVDIMEQDSSLILLTFGFKQDQLTNLKTLYSIVEHTPLEQVLKNSALKKKLFQELTKLKNFIPIRSLNNESRSTPLLGQDPTYIR